MVSNQNRPEFHYLAGRYPDRIGHLYSPGGQRNPFPWLPYALDNGAFPAWEKGEPFPVDGFRRLLDWAAKQDQAPLWVLCPDVVANREATLESWDRWYPELRAYGWPIAFALQDGMTKADVPGMASVAFLGGSAQWKRRTLTKWQAVVERLHVGRVNHRRLLWRCAEIGVESVDGTGWFHKSHGQLYALMQFCEAYTNGRRHDPNLPEPLVTHP